MDTTIPVVMHNSSTGDFIHAQCVKINTAVESHMRQLELNELSSRVLYMLIP